MTTLLQALGEILRSNLVNRGSIVLEETSPKSTCKPITLHKSGQSFVLQPDRVKVDGDNMAVNDRLFPLFRRDVPNLVVMCDYMIFCQRTSGDYEELFVFHCELKSNNPEGSRQQIENGKLLADYILAMALHHVPVRAMPIIKQRGLVFSPKFAAPQGSLVKYCCQYNLLPDGFDDLPFAYYGSGKEYPLAHFCV